MSAPFYSEHQHTARVPHRCAECAHEIPRRSRYTKVVRRERRAGPIDTFDICATCLAWGQALHAAPHGFWRLGLLWTCIRDYCRDVLGYDPHEARR